eukprot:COSAG02_NODE_157_length_32999_cov_31.863647_16_plen_88_part_00
MHARASARRPRRGGGVRARGVAWSSARGLKMTRAKISGGCRARIPQRGSMVSDLPGNRPGWPKIGRVENRRILLRILRIRLAENRSG